MDALSYEQLLARNQQQERLIEQLRQTVLELQKRVEELERSAKRQAAPFSKGEPKKNPRTPGRKKGEEHGKHGHREPPPSASVDETHNAPLPNTCPECGGAVVEDRVDQQFQTDLPRKPVTRQFNIHCGHCSKCGKRVRGRHPLQTSAATGAAQSQLGADAQAAIVYLNKRGGMSHGKIADAFGRILRIHVTRGACAQVVVRARKKLQPVYEQIKKRLQSSGHLTPDETGWRIGGRPAWLHAWVGDHGATLYAIDPQRSADVLEKVIGIHWSGSMTHDGFSSYDRFENAAHQQCVDHALRRARGLCERHHGAAKIFPQRVIALLTAALRCRELLNQEQADLERRGRIYYGYVERLRALTAPARRNSANARFAKHLSHHAAGWFLFLIDPAIPATNHRAEQALKTPIVNRKVWGGNRTAAGGQAQAVVGSVLQTCTNQARDPFTFFRNAFRGALDTLIA